MIYIGMDISLSSTALTINDDGKEHIYCYLNDNKTSKWANLLEGINGINIKRIKNVNKGKNYSESEVLKLMKYDEISNLIISDIKDICMDKECIIKIEGYSYTKNTNSIIDIIGLSTQLRLKLLKNLNCHLQIISPSTLKKEICQEIYGITEIKRFSKKGTPLKSEFKIINNKGLSGGKFTKFEIYESILDGNIDTIIFDFLRDYKNDILSMKKIPSPIDDINDSIMLSKINFK